MKTEPTTFSISDLESVGTTPWEGVRNFQARNFMMNEMSEGDKVLLYHSNCSPSYVAGLAEVVSEAYPDLSQYDKNGQYFEKRATKEKPIWFLVDIGFVEKFERPLDIHTMRSMDKLSNLSLLKKGQRLSILPVSKTEFDTIVKYCRG